MTKVKNKSLLGKLIKILIFSISLIFFLFVIFIVVINLNPVKQKIAEKVLVFLHDKYNVDISFENIKIDYLGDAVLNDIKIKDNHNFDFIKAKELKLKLNTLSLITNLNSLEFSYIRIDRPDINIITYQNEEHDNFTNFIEKFKSKKKKTKSNFKLSTRIDIIDGKLSIKNLNKNASRKDWLLAENLNLKIPSLKVDNENVDALVNKISFDYTKGNKKYSLKQLKTNFKYTNKQISLKGITLITDSSFLDGNLAFKYNDTHDFSNFINKVNWDLNLNDGSIISGKDIGYFADIWDKDEAVFLKGHMIGTLNNFKISNLKLNNKESLIVSDWISIKNVISKNNDIEISTPENSLFQTSYSSINDILPSFIMHKIPIELSKLGNCIYNGEFFLNKENIKVNGNLITSLGTITSDAKLINYSSPNPSYEGFINTNNFNLNPFVSSLGPISLYLDLAGKGFNPESMNTDFKGTISSLQLNNGNKISNTTVDGNIKDKIFNGKIKTDDQNISLDMNGIIDFSKKNIKTDVKVKIDNANLKYFTSIVNDNIYFKGNINSNIEVRNIYDILGEITISDVKFITKNKDKEDDIKTVDLIKFVSKEDGEKRNLDISASDMFFINLHGKYSLLEVPDMIKESLGNLLVNYIPKTSYKDKQFSFILDIQKNFFDLLNLKIDMSKGTTIYGDYNGDTNNLNTHIISEYVNYEGIKISSPTINLNTADINNQISGNIANIDFGSINLNNFNISAKKINDTLFAKSSFDLRGKSSNLKDDLNKKSLGIKIETYQTRSGDEFLFGFKDSEITFPKKVWKFKESDQDGNAHQSISYNIKNKNFSIHDLSLVSDDNSSLYMNASYASAKNYIFDIVISNTDISSLIPPFLLSNTDLKGIINGKLNVERTDKTFSPVLDIKIDGLEYNNTKIGDALFLGNYESDKNRYAIDCELKNNEEKTLALNGYINETDDNSAQKLDLKLSTYNFDISPAGIFMEKLFSNFRGYVTGDILIKGNVNKPEYNGTLKLDKFGTSVIFNGVDYETTKPENIKISNGYLLFDNIELKDTSLNTKADMFGVIATKNFTVWGIDLDISTDKILALNTTKGQNRAFYGRVFAKGNFAINGSTDSKINMNANLSVLSGSKLTIDNSNSSASTVFPYIKYVTRNETTESKTEKSVGLSINANIKVDKSSTIELILNPENKITVKGNSDNINFKLNESGRITMNGLYTIAEGSSYSFQLFLDKDFEIKPGSSIRWSGNSPTDAEFNITANYTAGVSNLGEYLDIASIQSTDIVVSAIIKGQLSKPELKFELSAPNTTSSIQEALKAKLNNSTNETSNQVASIVLFSSFISGNKSSSSYASAAYELALKQVTNAINNITDYFKINARIDPGNGISGDRLKLDPKFILNKRVVVKTIFNIPLERTNPNDVLTYGAEVNIDISKSNDKSLNLQFFSRPSTFGDETKIISNHNNQAIGAGISYERGFDSFNFFKTKAKTKPDKKKKNINLEQKKDIEKDKLKEEEKIIESEKMKVIEEEEKNK